MMQDDDDTEDPCADLRRELAYAQHEIKSLRTALNKKHQELALKSGEVDRVLAERGAFAEWWSTGVVVAVSRTHESQRIDHAGGTMSIIPNAYAEYDVTLNIRSASHEGLNAGDYARKRFKIIGA